MNAFKILSWNILGAQASDLALVQTKYPDVVNWPKKFNQLISKIISFDTDIVCLQEIDSSLKNPIDANTKKDFQSALEKHGFSIASYESKNNNGGALVLYKSEKFRCVDHSGTSLKINNELGVCAWATLQCKKTLQNLLVASIHLHWQFQKKQLEILAQSLKESITIPTIIAGDFNIPYPTMVSEIVPYIQHLNIMKQQELLMFEHSSWTTQPPHHQDLDCWESLDHILFSNDLKLNSTNSFVANPECMYKDDRVKTIATMKDSNQESIPNDTCPSDHLPIIASFTLS